jgi:hypothetical protein
MRYAKKMIWAPYDVYMAMQQQFASQKSPTTPPKMPTPKPEVTSSQLDLPELQENEYVRANRKILAIKQQNEQKPLLIKIQKDVGSAVKPKNEPPGTKKSKKKLDFLNTTNKTESDNESVTENSSFNATDHSELDESNVSFDTSLMYDKIKKLKPDFLGPEDGILKTDQNVVYQRSNLKKSLEYLSNPTGNAPPGTKRVENYIKLLKSSSPIQGKGLLRFVPKTWKTVTKNYSKNCTPRQIYHLPSVRRNNFFSPPTKSSRK